MRVLNTISILTLKVISKRIDELKVWKKEMLDSTEDTDEITQIFIETTELEVSI